MSYVYFDHAGRFPFDPRKTEYSHVNAWWLAECSFLAYTHPGYARMAFALEGFPGFRFFQNNSVECMVAWNASSAVVVFRGTELRSVSAIREISTDLNAAPTPFNGDGQVHRGFFQAFKDVFDGDDGLAPFLTELIEAAPKRPLWITGHSLGGALATLLFSVTPTATGLYVFGSPRVGDGAFAASCAGRPVWRVENGLDPIVHLPPAVKTLKVEYVPVGSLKYLDEAGEITETRPEFSSARMKRRFGLTVRRQLREVGRIFKRGKWWDRRIAREVVEQLGTHLRQSRKEWKRYLHEVERETGMNIDDHMPVLYTNRLWNKAVSSRQG
jgi:hypothetical protein